MSEKEITTMVISKETKQKLDDSKEHHRETYEDVIKRLIEKSNEVKIK